MLNTTSDLKYARIGAIIYILWSVLHIFAAWFILDPALAPLEELDPSAAHGRIYQNSGLMLTISIVSIMVAWKMNWHNNALGYWLNLLLVSGTDIAFISFVLIPGYEPPLQGLVGPALWIIATIFSTLGYIKRNRAIYRVNDRQLT
jgi:hypothetical protein